MYFESRLVPIHPAQTPQQIVKLLDAWKSASYTRPDDGEQIIFVDDGHIDASFSEIAVVNQSQGYQIESLTWAWMDSQKEKLQFVNQCLTTDFVFARGVTVPLDYETEKDKLKTFTCSCCGRWFESTLAKQRPYDCDNGYGVCKRCESFYH